MVQVIQLDGLGAGQQIETAMANELQLKVFYVQQSSSVSVAELVDKLAQEICMWLRDVSEVCLSPSSFLEFERLAQLKADQGPHLAQALVRGSRETRIAAARCFSKLPASAFNHLPWILEALSDNEPIVSAQLAHLVRAADAGLRNSVLEVLARNTRSDNLEAKSGACRSLGHLGSAAVSQADLLYECQSDIEVEVQVAATVALQQISNDEKRQGRAELFGCRALTYCLKALNSDNWKLRRSACCGLGLLENEAAPSVPQIITLLADEVAEIREQADRTLSKLAACGVSVHPEEQQAARCAGRLYSESVASRRTACLELGALGGKAVPFFTAVVRRFPDEDSTVFSAALRVVGQIREAGAEVDEEDLGLAVAQVAAGLASESSRLRREACRRLGVLGAVVLGAVAAGDLTSIAKCLSDTDAMVRQAAAQALEELAATGVDVEAVTLLHLPQSFEELSARFEQRSQVDTKKQEEWDAAQDARSAAEAAEQGRLKALKAQNLQDGKGDLGAQRRKELERWQRGMARITEVNGSKAAEDESFGATRFAGKALDAQQKVQDSLSCMVTVAASQARQGVAFGITRGAGRDNDLSQREAWAACGGPANYKKFGMSPVRYVWNDRLGCAVRE